MQFEGFEGCTRLEAILIRSPPAAAARDVFDHPSDLFVRQGRIEGRHSAPAPSDGQDEELVVLCSGVGSRPRLPRPIPPFRSSPWQFAQTCW